jgi:glycerol kinase
MTDSLILAIDQGGQSSRVAVYRATGEQVCCFSAACATLHLTENGRAFVEQNPREILQGIRNCLAQVAQVLGEDLGLIKSAGFAGQGSSLLCWDRNTGEALSPVLSWQDIRGQNYLSSLALTHQQAQEITGLRVSPHYGASKIKWCLMHNEKAIAALHAGILSVGPIVSYIFQHLFNEPAHQPKVDPGHAQRTLLWNLHQNQWDQRLLGLFAIPEKILPSCLYHSSRFGVLSLGDQSIPFTASARDQGASLFARGQPDKSACYINIGTGAFIQRITNQLTAPDGLLVSPLWIAEPEQGIEVASPTCYLPDAPLHSHNLYAWEATVNGAASAISYLQDQTGLSITPEDIDRALNIEPSHECYFLNAVGGLSAPWWRTDLNSQFSEHLTPDEKILAWLESIIFQIAVNVQLMNQQEPAKKIYISGGLSNADSLCQKVADLTCTPVIRSDNADATLQGIANMAGGLKAAWNPRIADDQFEPALNPSLMHRFNQWRQAMEKWLG